MSKIKVSELRLGNHIRYFGDMEGYVISISDVGSPRIFATAKGGGYTEIGDTAEGISLTEEWLLKFNFKKEPLTHSINISYFDTELKLLCVDLNQGILIRNGNLKDNRMKDELIPIFNTDKSGAIQVHQLQNLYFALTGKEL